VEVVVSPTDICRRNLARHEQATARRMLLPLQKRQGLLLKSSGPMGSVQSSRWDAAIFLMIPGTSCLATIGLSLRDKTIRPSKRLAIILALMG
jgi:hypothetical protein